MAIVNLSAPWMTFYKKVNALFKNDLEVFVLYDDEAKEIKLFVDNPDKADALAQLIPVTHEFGNVTLKVTVVPPNKVRYGEPAEASFETALAGNGAFSYAVTVGGVLPFDITYVVFKKEVVQFFNDDLSDIHGNCTTLYQNIAEDVFGKRSGVFFCTDN